MHASICVLLCLGYNLVSGLQSGSPCVTPNGENALCISINSCAVIKQSIAYLDEGAVEFARKSQCGYDGSPLVCCGSTGRLTPTTTAASYPKPSVPSYTRPPSVPESSASLHPIDDLNLPDHSLCGIQTKQNRIVGGNVTEIDEFPWLVALKYTKSDGSAAGFRCSGTLINQRHVLTAAQCLDVKGFNLTGVRLGEWRFSTKEDCFHDGEAGRTCADPAIDVGIQTEIPHPFYSKRSGNNDLALLRLDTKIKFTDYIRPICLPPIDYPFPSPGTPMHIAGWGVTENGTFSDVKLKSIVPIVNNEICQNHYPKNTAINNNQACAGGEEGKDACKGDAGGPLMRTYIKEDDSEEEQWLQEGIIQSGVGCGRKGVPGIYTRVSRYVNWILNQIKE